KWRDKTMQLMKVPKGDTALDVCCGTGDWTIALADAAGETVEIKGLDFSKNMLSIAEQKTESYSQIDLIHGNAMELPFPDNTFDFVTIGFGLRNVPDY
ncbi:class I SAM-dependent methyltransferase, partial [Bacillus licheniformis]|uniref:class I SAM-dependent methyltransferase n=1 Tax=Bacillus licheniformis TaxID=1402 RepID=UPI0034A0688A